MSSSSLFSASASATPAREIPADNQPAAPTNNSGTVPVWRSAALLILAAVVGLTYLLNPPLDIQAQSGVIMDLPVLLGDFVGHQAGMTQVESNVLPKDTELSRRNYIDSHQNQITCSIVLSGAEQRSIHRPEGCLTGQGWTIIGQDYIPIPLTSGHKLTARKLTLERRARANDGSLVVIRAYYIYWFVGENVSTPSEIERVLLSNWDRVVHNRAHRWAYVSFFSVVLDNLRPDGLNADQTQALMLDFARQIVPTFQISEMPAQAKN